MSRVERLLERFVNRFVAPVVIAIDRNPLTFALAIVLGPVLLCSGIAYHEYRYPCVESHQIDATCFHYQTVRVGDKSTTISTPYPCKRTICDRREERR